MLIAFAWFTEKGQPYDAQSRGLHQRLQRFVNARVPESWHSQLMEGTGWGLFATAVGPGGWNWDLVARDHEMLVATVGIPVGLDGTLIKGGPICLARAALKNHQALDGVVPPFGLMATDGNRFIVQQDWFGMASLYVYRSQGVVAFSNRPMLLPYALGDPVQPNPVAWARYAACDTFAGPIAPVAGVEALGPGKVIILKKGLRNRWKAHVRQGVSLDDIAVAGSKLPAGADLEGLALSGLSRVSSSLALLWPQALKCGLSGGRDSRLLAANLIANGIRPALYTTTENAAEGRIATELVELARKAGRGEFIHTLVPPRKGGGPGSTGLAQRLKSLFLNYDFSYRRQSVIRESGPCPAQIPDAAINGAIGDIAHVSWVPRHWERPYGNPTSDIMRSLRRGLASKAGGALVDPASTWLDEYLAELTSRASNLKLNQLQALIWSYCASRGRTWPTARQNFHQTMPFATPEFVSAVIALPLARVKNSDLHRKLIERLLPEWGDVEFAQGQGSSVERVPYILDGDGSQVLGELLESTTGQLTWMLDRSVVESALVTGASGDVDIKSIVKSNQILSTFAVLATAEREFAALNSELKAF